MMFTFSISIAFYVNMFMCCISIAFYVNMFMCCISIAFYVNMFMFSISIAFYVNMFCVVLASISMFMCCFKNEYVEHPTKGSKRSNENNRIYVLNVILNIVQLTVSCTS